MKFSFEEAELINYYLEDENNISKLELIEKINDIKNKSEDKALIELLINITSKLKILLDDQYNDMISNLPVDIISIY
ncbi:hypothetical protein [Clostridium butyricum]|uniref:hypothetical protein n=1 Tax=Clostridium butyricum TaxID=1492 RepID=UPI00374F1F84